MELFTWLFSDLLTFVYHCFDHIVIHGYLSGLSRPEQVVHFVHHALGIPVVSKEVFSRRTDDYRSWVEAYARNHKLPMEWAEYRDDRRNGFGSCCKAAQRVFRPDPLFRSGSKRDPPQSS